MARLLYIVVGTCFGPKNGRIQSPPDTLAIIALAGRVHANITISKSSKDCFRCAVVVGLVWRGFGACAELLGVRYLAHIQIINFHQESTASARARELTVIQNNRYLPSPLKLRARYLTHSD